MLTASFLVNNFISNVEPNKDIEQDLGISIKPLDILSVSIDCNVKNNYFILMVGMEYWVRNISLRCGINSNEISFGAGIDLKKFYIDLSSYLRIGYYQQIPSLRISFSYNL